METVEIFKYFGRVADKSYYDFLELQSNLVNLSRFWWCSGKILGRKVSDEKTYGLFYCMMINYIIFYGSEARVITVPIIAALEDIYTLLSNRIMIMKPGSERSVNLLYPHSVGFLRTLGINVAKIYLVEHGGEMGI